MHEQDRFASIEAGKFENTGNRQIKLVLKDKSVLPEGYTWEEAGREFSFKGEFYDIVSLKQTKNGWELIAASDEAETMMVENQTKAQQIDKNFTTNKHTNKLKISLLKLVYDCPNELDLTATHFSNRKYLLGFYNSQLALPFLGQLSPPPKADSLLSRQV